MRKPGFNTTEIKGKKETLRSSLITVHCALVAYHLLYSCLTMGTLSYPRPYRAK